MPDPMHALVAAVAEQVAEQVAARITPSTAAAAADPPPSGIVLWRAYTAREVGAMIGLATKSVYDIDHELLRPTYLGPGGGSKRYLGINVISYLAGLPPVDVEGIARRVREEFVAQAERPAAVRALPGSGGQGARRRVH